MSSVKPRGKDCGDAVSQPRMFPKILFVNDFAPDSLAVADLSRQLLLGYPADHISWWYWRTMGIRGLKDLPVGSLYHWRLQEWLLPKRRLRRARGVMMEWICSPLAAMHLRRAIAAVKPDVVWVLLFAWPIMVAHKARLGHGHKLHVSLWDYPDTNAHVRTLGPARSSRFLQAVYGMVRRAYSFDGISPSVLEDLAAQAGRNDGVLVHSGFEPNHLKALENSLPAADDGSFRLAYVGTIISEKAFFELLVALSKLRTTLAKPVVLEFYGARGYKSRTWFDPAWMAEHGVFSDQGLVESLQRCSWGIVVVDPEGEDLRYSRFSFPNKVGTYLSAGVPVLGVGHQTSSLADVMRCHEVGMFTTASTCSGLESFLAEAFKIAQPRLTFRDGILGCARSEFDAQRIRSRLWARWRGEKSSEGAKPQ